MHTARILCAMCGVIGGKLLATRVLLTVAESGSSPLLGRQQSSTCTWLQRSSNCCCCSCHPEGLLHPRQRPAGSSVASFTFSVACQTSLVGWCSCWGPAAAGQQGAGQVLLQHDGAEARAAPMAPSASTRSRATSKAATDHLRARTSGTAIVPASDSGRQINRQWLLAGVCLGLCRHQPRVGHGG